MAEPRRFLMGELTFTYLDLLEMGIPADVVKALVDYLEIKDIPHQEEQDGRIEVQ